MSLLIHPMSLLIHPIALLIHPMSLLIHQIALLICPMSLLVARKWDIGKVKWELGKNKWGARDDYKPMQKNGNAKKLRKMPSAICKIVHRTSFSRLSHCHIILQFPNVQKTPSLNLFQKSNKRCLVKCLDHTPKGLNSPARGNAPGTWLPYLRPPQRGTTTRANGRYAPLGRAKYGGNIPGALPLAELLCLAPFWLPPSSPY